MMEERERNGKDDNSRRIAILVFRVRGSLPPLFDLLPPFFLFFFFRKSHTDWMDAGRATSASSRNSRNLSHGGELAGQATSERKKRIDVPIHYVPSPGLDSGGSGNTDVQRSLSVAFSHCFDRSHRWKLF